MLFTVLHYYLRQGLTTMLLFATLAHTGAARGATLTWTNIIGGDWSTAANWSPNVVPGAGDTANLSAAGSYTVAVSANGLSVDTITVGSGSGSQVLQIQTGAALAINDSLTVNGSASCTVGSGGVLGVGGNLVLFGPLTNSGTINVNDGFIQIANNGTLTSQGGLVNGPSGIINFSGNEYIVTWDGVGPNDYFINQGTVNKLGGNGDSIINPSVLVLSGTWNTAAGNRILFQGGTAARPVTQDGTLNISGAGQAAFSVGVLLLDQYYNTNLVLAGGSIELGPHFQQVGAITNLSLNGATLAGSNVVTGTLMTAKGSTIGGPLSIASGGLLAQSSASYPLTVGPTGWINIESGGTLDLLGTLVLQGPLTNAGTINVTNDYVQIANNGTLAFQGGLMNGPSGVINFYGDEYVVTWDGVGPNDYFINQGTVNKVGGNGASVISPSVFVLSGTWNTAAGEQFVFQGGTTALPIMQDGTLTITGDGQTEFKVGVLLLDQSYNTNLILAGGKVELGPHFQQAGAITNLSLNGSTLIGSNLVTGTLAMAQGSTIGGPLVVANGGLLAQNSGGNSITVAPEGSVTIQSGGTFSAQGIVVLQGPLTNEGTINVTNDFIQIANNGTPTFQGGLVNGPSGVINFYGNEYVETWDGIGPNDYFINQGTLNKLAGNGASYIAPSIMVNQGTLNVQEGSLTLNPGQITISSSSILNFAINSATDWGAITWGGSASHVLDLAGSVTVNLNNGFVPTVGSTFKFLSINNGGTFSGTFSSVVAEAPPVWTVASSPAAWNLNVVSLLSWPAPSAIVYGTPLSAMQLDASASAGVTGTFNYTPPLGTVLPVGRGQTLSVHFSPNNPSYLPANLQVPIQVGKAPLNIMARNLTKVYGQTITFAGTEYSATGLQNGDAIGSVTLTSAGAMPTAGVGTYPIVSSAAAGGNFSPSNYAITYHSGTLTVTPAPVTISAGVAALNKVYDHTTGALLTTGTVVLNGIVNGDNIALNTNGYTAAFPQVNVGNNLAVTVQGLTLAGANAADYRLIQPAGLSASVTPRTVTVRATANSKVYDGTTTAGAIPTITSGSLAAGDTGSFTEVYGSKNAGTELTLIPSGAVSDGNAGNNYSITFASAATGVINPRTITVTAGTNKRVYDGTAMATAIPAITSGSLAAGDTPGFRETYKTRDVGITKTLIPSGSVNDGNSGNNYNVTFVNASSGVISARPITVAAVANTKIYDGTISAITAPTITSGALGTGDTAGFIETYNNRNAGSGKTLTPSGAVADGNSGNNYTVTFVDATSGVITAQPVTVTATPNVKGYDGTTSASAMPSITAGSLGAGDTANLTETYATKIVGTSIRLTPTGSISDGNAGNNYTVTFASANTGVITARALAVTASSNSKSYDGTTTAAAIPTITSGSLVPGDTGSFTEAYSSKNAGTGLPLIPNGTVNDGNAGKNYNITFTSSPTGVINARAITVTAGANRRVYDGTAAASAIPAITSGSLADGDSPGFTEAYNNRHIGIGKTLTPAGAVNDGNSGNNYNVTFVSANSGVISARPITVTAAANTKVYDGTTTAVTPPMITSGTMGTGDTAGFIETYNNRNAGSGKPLTPSGAVADGNSGNNYNVTFVSAASGVITPEPVTVTAAPNIKGYDGTTSATAVPTLTAGSLGTGDTANFGETYVSKLVGTGIRLTPSGTISDGNGGNNYTISFASATTGVITARALTVTASSNSKVYDGTTSAAAVPTITSGSLVTGDTASFTEVYGSKNAGTGLTLIPSGTVHDGNAGNNYAVTFSNTTGTITKAALNVVATGANKAYDATTTASVSLSDNRITGDSLSESYTAAAFASPNVAKGVTINVTGIAVTGQDSANYTWNATATSAANINPASLLVTASSAVRLVGQPNPEFSGTLTGVQLGDAITAIYSSPATPASPVGSYPITARLLDPNLRLANYQVTANPALLTVINPPTFQSIAAKSGSVDLSWNSVPGLVYQLQYTTSLNQQVKINLGTPITATGANTTYTDTPGTDQQRFYSFTVQP